MLEKHVKFKIDRQRKYYLAVGQRCSHALLLSNTPADVDAGEIAVEQKCSHALLLSNTPAVALTGKMDVEQGC